MTTARPIRLLALAVLMLSAAASIAEEPADGLFVTVPNPITSDVFNRVKETVTRVRHQTERPIRTLVFDFNPDGKEAATRDFGPCADLADFLLSLNELNTVAFVRNKVTRHTVLPVLACKELVMARDALLGEVASPDQPGGLPEYQVQFYARIAGEGRAALAVKMFDRTAEVLEGRRNGAVWYATRRNEADAVKAGVVGLRPASGVAGPGELALYTADQAQKLGLCRLVRESRQEVAEAYGLSPTSLREDPLQGRTPVAWKLTIRGSVTRGLDESVRRGVRRALAAGANLIIFQLECGGGDTVAARSLADFLRTLRDEQDLPVLTVAFIPTEAPDTATFIAFGCSEIVMGKEAVLGDFESVLRAPPLLPPRGRPNAPPPQEPERPNTQPIIDSLVELAREQGYPPLLARGMLEPDLEIVRVHNLRGPAERKLVTATDLEEDRRAPQPRWADDGQLKPAGRVLKLTATLAKELGVARHIVENPREVREVYALYGLDPTRVREAGPDWLDGLAAFLRNPAVAAILVMLGIGGLILELKAPGLGVPGVTAAIAFVLFFWSQSQLSGQFTILAILLFLLGMVFLGIEIFLTPGFGLPGISGIILIVCGLGLATVERVPQTSQEWTDFGGTVMTFGGSMIMAVMLAAIVARYLPHIPGANRMVLAPPEEQPGEDMPAPAVATGLASLLGEIGVAATMLRPAGMAKFGERMVDVVSEGDFVEPGTRVQVVEIEGNRVVVKAV